MIALPFPTLDKNLNRSAQVNGNFSYLSSYLSSEIEYDSFARRLSGTLNFVGPALVLSSTGTLTESLVDVSASLGIGAAFDITATTAFDLSSDLTVPWVQLTQWAATGGTATATNFIVGGTNDSAVYGAFATNSLPTPASDALTFDTTTGTLKYYHSGWLNAFDAWLAAPFGVLNNTLTVLGQPRSTYGRLQDAASGTTSAVVTSFVKNRASSYLAFVIGVEAQKTTGASDSGAFSITVTLKVGATTLQRWQKGVRNNSTGAGRNLRLPILWWDNSLAAGTNTFTVTISHNSASTVSLGVDMGVTEL